MDQSLYDEYSSFILASCLLYIHSGIRHTAPHTNDLNIIYIYVIIILFGHYSVSHNMLHIYL